MRINQAYTLDGKNWTYLQKKSTLHNPLVFVFGNRMELQKETVIEAVRKEFPYEHLVFGSTSGEIIDSNVFDNSVVVTAIEFEKSTFEIRTENIFNHHKDAKQLGESLYNALPKENLRHLFVLSEGSFVNGSSLIEGLEKNIENAIPISGGMCGDDAKFEKTLASYKENPKEGEVVFMEIL